MARRRRQNRKWLIGGVILIVLMIGGVVGVVIWNNNRNNNGGDEQETEKVEDNKKEELSDDGDGLDEVEVDEKKVVQYDGDDPNEAEELSGVVTYAGVNDGVLMVRINIDQYVTSGSCELALVRGSTTIYNSTARIIGDVTTATCEGFDIPVSEISAGGAEINIKLNADGKSGLIRGEVNI